DEDLVIQEYASVFLAEMTRERYSCIKALEDPILDVLLTKMVSSDPDIQKNSLQILVNILDDPMCAQDISKSPDMDLKPLVAHILSDYPIIRFLALQALESLHVPEYEHLNQQFKKAGGVEIFMEVLENMEWKDLHKLVLKYVANCYREDEIKHLIAVSGPVILKSYMRRVKDFDLIEATLIVVAKMAAFEIGRKVLHEGKMELELYELMKLGKESILAVASQIMALMAQHYDCLEVIAKLNPLKDMINAITSETFTTTNRLIVTQALSELLRLDSRLCDVVMDENKHELLENLLCSPAEVIPVEMKVCLIACLKQLAYFIDIRNKMIEGNYINSLLCCFKDHDRSSLLLRVEACDALANVLSDNNGRVQFLSLNGVEHIMECLKDSYLKLNQAAATIIVVTSCDYEVIRAFIKAGALDWMLQEKEKITRYECPVWEAAIEAIFRCYLPIKFAYVNRLDPQDITEEGFYVARQVERPFIIIEELMKNEVSPIRPIYIANFRTEHKIISKISMSPSFKTGKISGKQRRSSMSLKKREGTSSSSSSRKIVSMTDKTDSALQETWIRDHYLYQYLENLKKKLRDVTQYQKDGSKSSMLEKMIQIVAQFVCDQMVGNDPNSKYDIHRQDLHLNELKVELCSNIIPLGYIRIGGYLERAMLFKVLADRVGLPCALVRGHYHRAWVEVAIPQTVHCEKLPSPTSTLSKSSSFLTTPSGLLLHHVGTQWLPQPEDEIEIEPQTSYIKKFTPNYMIKPNRIVDLMDDIGSLYPLNSFKAMQYCNKPQIYFMLCNEQ
ncbi:hypothetical protein L9F63_013817, partial [Diploptera punctata]